MASFAALYTGMTGLNANSRNLDVIGNNVANSNTTAYKSSRLSFSNMFSRTLTVGSPPGDSTGGTNPYQIGNGVQTAGTQRNFANGTISATGNPRDLAIDGRGFFVVERGDQAYYTRAGDFRFDADNNLTTPTGELLQGYGVNTDFEIERGALQNVQIPIGSLTIAEATENVRFRGNLNAAGALPTTGTSIDILGDATTGLRAVSGANPPPGAGNRLADNTRLVDIEDPILPGTGARLFTAGQMLEVANAQRGGRTLPSLALPITATTTVAEMNEFLAVAMGINTGTGPNPDGETPGVSVDAPTGILSVIGNLGTINDLQIDAADLRVLDSAGQTVRQPFVTEKKATADGESLRTAFIAFDSLGTPIEVQIGMVLESRANTGTTWRYFVESDATMGDSTQLATGTLSFDTEGNLITLEPVEVQIDRSGTGATSPMTVSLKFSEGGDRLTALTDTTSVLQASFRDGSPIGTLEEFGVGADGVILGTFSNGLTRTLGQVVVATFSNSEGLVDEGDNLFRVGSNSGSAVVGEPRTLGAGQLVGGSLELSNVDIGEEFIKMILSSTGYSASSRVIRTADELMQQLMVLGR
jgi:flagellar hook protein FlgE